MAVLVIMPKQGQSVESCIITELKKKVGDPVKKGEVLFSYETDKASFEEESLSLIHIFSTGGSRAHTCLLSNRNP